MLNKIDLVSEKEIKEVDGSSMLDNSIVDYGAGLGDGSTHQRHPSLHGYTDVQKHRNQSNRYECLYDGHLRLVYTIDSDISAHY